MVLEVVNLSILGQCDGALFCLTFLICTFAVLEVVNLSTRAV